MNPMYYILIGVIVLVVAVDFYVKNKKKKSDSTDIDFPEKKEKSSNVLIITICSLLVFILTGFFVADNYYYDGRLTNNDDQFSIIDIIKYHKYNESYCNGTLYDDDGLSLKDKITLTYFDYNKVELVGDSMYQQKGLKKYLNGILNCDYGNIGKVINGKPHGLFTLYHANGQKKMQVNLVNGIQEGLREDWYSNGQKEFEGYYENDKQIGTCKFWFSNGQIELEGEYDKGHLSGNYIRYFNDGKIKYVYDHTEKTFKEYWDNGNIYIDAHSVYSPQNPLHTRIGGSNEVIIDYYTKNDGRIMDVYPRSRLKKPYGTKESHLWGGPCKSKINCVWYNYFLNGEVYLMSYLRYDNVLEEKFFYQNGRLNRHFVGDDWKFYNRNGKLHRETNNFKEENRGYDENGKLTFERIGEKYTRYNRLFSKNKELDFGIL